MPLLDRRNLPNALTVLRLLLAATFFGTLELYDYPDGPRIWGNAAIALFIAAAFTDFLDGFLARRWQAITMFGRIMDPFCDKILVLGAFIYMTGPRFTMTLEGGEVFIATGVAAWMVVVILARELLVTAIRGVVESQGVSFGAKWSGKSKMVLQSVAIPIVLFIAVNLEPHEREWAAWTAIVLDYAMVVVTVWSGLPYVMGIRRSLPPEEASDRPA